MTTRIEVNITKQRLVVKRSSEVIATFQVSTAKKGTGQQQGSEQTPLGLHRIAEKIGDGQDALSVFVGRKPTGELFSDALAAAYPNRDWILTRILRLEGLEPGFNKGGDVDSYARFIYIHGCPVSRPVGEPHSHGCITLHPKDMLKLFALVQKGDEVMIL